jgi:alkylated DNA repair dioxygenase AlkB
MKVRGDAAADDLFGPKPELPEGFSCRPDVISTAEEKALVGKIEKLPFKPFDFHGFQGKRQIVSYGWHYDYSGRGALKESSSIPEFLFPLRAVAAKFAAVDVEGLQQVLVTEYAPGAGIGWHRDKPMFEDVIAVSLLSPCRLRFRRKEGETWERATIEVEPRSVYLLRGPSRRQWEHSIPGVDALRYSVTFRNFIPDR